MSKTRTDPFSFTYDGYGRVTSVTDARTGATNFTYDALGQLLSSGGNGQTLSYEYDNLGRKVKEILADASEVHFEYYPTGELKKSYGSQTYPVEYTYDTQGRIKTLKTTGQAGASITTWTYDSASGLLSSKTYADDNGTAYTYTPGGRLQTRTWQRGIVTTYGYDNGGDLVSVSYSDGTTPGVVYTRNRLGQVVTVADASGSRTYTYKSDGQPESETWNSGLFNGASFALGYDSLNRRNSLQLSTSAGTLLTHSFGYDNAGRIQTVNE